MGGLRVEVTSFVGRAEETARVSELLGVARLITLIGPGGVGKTRIALRAAAREESRFAYGARLVELSGLKDGELLPHAVSEALGIPEQSSRPQIDALVEHLAERETLLVLDTCEHLLDACALLADLLLAEAPGVTLLATSRQALDTQGEHVLSVPPLPLPGGEGGEEGKEGKGGKGAEGDSDALALLVQRARAVAPGFALTPHNRAYATALCRRLDGMPLAIELAAVRLRALPLDQLLAQLDDSFALLARGRMTTLPRHRTLRATLDWSHDLCTPQERLLWARLSVFSGSFDLAAVSAVATDAELPVAAVLEPLIGLTEKSVVSREDPLLGRYRLLDTIREYGAEQLASSGGADACRARHLAHFGARAAAFATGFATDGQLTEFHALAAVRADLRAALGHAAEAGDSAGLLGLTARMWPYWACAGLPREAVSWMERALSGGPRADPDWVTTAAWHSMFTGNLGDLDRALAVAQDAVTASAGLPDGPARAWAALAAADAHYHRADHEHGLARCQEALALAQAAADPGAQRVVNLHLSIAHLLAGRPAEALSVCGDTLALLGEGSRECYVQGSQYSTRGLAHFQLGAYEEAARDLRAAVRLKGELGDVLGVAAGIGLLAWLAAHDGRVRRAAWLFGAASAQWRRVGRDSILGNDTMRQAQERYERTTRETLGERVYHALRLKGAALTLEQAVQLAGEDAEAPAGIPRQRAVAADPVQARGRLTAREDAVAGLAADGFTNREIAVRLSVAKRTVDAHMNNLMRKLGLTSRHELAAVLGRDAHR